MATVKRVLCRERIRQVPRTFSWIDHRLVRDGHINRCSHEALALYLFLVTVADAEGLSFYSDTKLGGMLNMGLSVLISTRRELCEAELIVFRRPLYQVLSLDDPATRPPVAPTQRSCRGPDGAMSIGEVLRQALSEGEGQ